jgi:hypothetical protein
MLFCDLRGLCVERKPMTAFQALRDGIRRVTSALVLLVGVWVMTLLVSLPLTLEMRSELAEHLDASLEADAAASGVNYDWMQEFRGRASGVGTTFSPTVIGFGASLDNLSAFVDQERRPLLIVCAAAVYLALWIFMAGGIIDRYARNRNTRVEGFLWASAVYAVRFLRLGLVAAFAYGLLFRVVHPWLFGTFFRHLTGDLTAERSAFLVRLALYGVFAIAVATCNLVFDYAKVRIVVEDRRSVLAALSSAVRFLRRNGGAASALYLADALLFGAVLALYAAVAPGAGSAGWSIWVGFAIGQLYLLMRLWVKLVFWASETAFFQGRLAHAGYVAAARPIWPDSPAAEAFGGFTPRTP